MVAIRNSWTAGLLEIRKLDGPPPEGFDCGRADQNHFLYQHAWPDQQALISTTYLFFIQGFCAGYLTVVMDGIDLSVKERGPGVRFRTTGALKAAQVGVDRRVGGQGLGQMIVAMAVSLALHIGEIAGCRYLTLDARPDLVSWYRGQGFLRNELSQSARLTEAERHGRDPERIPVSMRFDLREEL